ncbi:unnamed protein product, partial [Phaeothamnion confervicola]
NDEGADVDGNGGGGSENNGNGADDDDNGGGGGGSDEKCWKTARDHLLECTQLYEDGKRSAAAYYLDLLEVFTAGSRDPMLLPRVAAMAARMLP